VTPADPSQQHGTRGEECSACGARVGTPCCYHPQPQMRFGRLPHADRHLAAAARRGTGDSRPAVTDRDEAIDEVHRTLQQILAFARRTRLDDTGEVDGTHVAHAIVAIELECKRVLDRVRDFDLAAADVFDVIESLRSRA